MWHSFSLPQGRQTCFFWSDQFMQRTVPKLPLVFVVHARSFSSFLRDFLVRFQDISGWRRCLLHRTSLSFAKSFSNGGVGWEPNHCFDRKTSSKVTSSVVKIMLYNAVCRLQASFLRFVCSVFSQSVQWLSLLKGSIKMIFVRLFSTFKCFFPLTKRRIFGGTKSLLFVR